MLFFLAVLFAIPTYGMSLVAYLAWSFYKAYRRHCLVNGLSRLEKAILLVAKEYNGSSVGTSIDGLKYGEVTTDLVMKGIFPRKREAGFLDSEYEITIASMRFYVVISKAPDGTGLAIFRVRHAEAWIDEMSYFLLEKLYWYEETFSKYYLDSQPTLIVGAAHSEYYSEERVAVPEAIGNMTSLIALGFIKRSVARLPDSIGNLTKLEKLKLGGNYLTSLPPGLFKLTKLKLLTLWENQLTEIPEEIGNLQNLEGLDLTSNEDLRYLPDSIVHLKKLKRFYMIGTENVVLSKRQKAWIVDLLRAGASVMVDECLQNQVIAEFPEIANLGRNWFIGEEIAEASAA